MPPNRDLLAWKMFVVLTWGKLPQSDHFRICLMRKSRTETGNESQLITSSYKESNSCLNDLGYQPRAEGLNCTVGSASGNTKIQVKFALASLLHQSSQLPKWMGMVTQRLEIESLGDAWHGQTFFIRVFQLLGKPLGKNIYNIPSFSSKHELMSGILQLFLKGKEWGCCCRRTEFSVFPPFRPTFLTQQGEDWQRVLPVFCLEIPNHWKQQSLFLSFHSEEGHG